MLHVECCVCRVEADHLQREPVIFGKESPRAVVCIVIQLRQHNLIARLQFARERAGELEVQRGHVCAELHRLPWRIQEIFRGAMRLLFDFALCA